MINRKWTFSCFNQPPTGFCDGNGILNALCFFYSLLKGHPRHLSSALMVSNGSPGSIPQKSRYHRSTNEVFCSFLPPKINPRSQLEAPNVPRFVPDAKLSIRSLEVPAAAAADRSLSIWALGDSAEMSFIHLKEMPLRIPYPLWASAIRRSKSAGSEEGGVLEGDSKRYLLEMERDYQE